MNFNVAAKYLNVVQNFAFVELTEDAQSPIASKDLNELIKEVSLKIISASDLRPTLELMAQCKLSLREVCYIVVQSTDQKNAIDTPAKIENASAKTKVILTHVIKGLAKDFVQLSPADLNTMALLFGIHRAHEFAAEKIIAMPGQSTEIQEREEALNKLITLRNKYPNVIAEMPGSTFLATVDAKIKEETELLTALKTSLNKNVI